MWRGDLMRKHRMKKGLTQKELAEKLQVTEATASRWEANVFEPSPANAKAIAVLLDVTFEDLYTSDLSPEQLRMVKAIPILNERGESFVPTSLDALAVLAADHDFSPWYRSGDLLYVSGGDPLDGDLVIVEGEEGPVPGVLNLRNCVVVNPNGLHRYTKVVGRVGYMLERIGK